MDFESSNCKSLEFTQIKTNSNFRVKRKNGYILPCPTKVKSPGAGMVPNLTPPSLA